MNFDGGFYLVQQRRRRLVTEPSGNTPPTNSYYFLTASSLSADFTFVRASHAMMWDSSGQLTWAPNNELLNSASLSTQNVTTIAENYILSFTSTGSAGDSITLTGTSTAGPLLGNGASSGGRVYLAFTPTAGTLTLTVAGTVASAQLERVTHETLPRAYNATTGAIFYGNRLLNYDPATLVRDGLPIEPGVTNLCKNSFDHSSGTWATVVSITKARDATSVNGLANNAVTVSETAVTTGHYSLTSAISITGATPNTASIIFKAKSGSAQRYIGFGFIDNIAFGDIVTALWDTTTGVLQGSGGGSGGVVISAGSDDLGGGWFRGWVIGTFVHDTATGALISWGQTTSTLTYLQSYAGATANGWIVAHTQLEANSYMTSPIYTDANTVARAAETCAATTGAIGYNAGAGTLIAEFKAPEVNQIGWIAGFDSTGGANAIALYKCASGDTTTAGSEAAVYEAGATTIDLNGALSDGTVKRSGLTYNTSGSLYGSLSGGTRVSGTVRTPTPTAFSIGYRIGGTQYLGGRLRSVAYWNTELTQTEFEAKTVEDASYG